LRDEQRRGPLLHCRSLRAAWFFNQLKNSRLFLPGGAEFSSSLSLFRFSHAPATQVACPLRMIAISGAEVEAG
jgi:hypothetical protein